MTGDGRDGDDLRDAYRCLSCDERWYYTRRRCPACGADADERETYRLDAGVLEATTVAAVTPPDVRADNALGLARFDGDVGVVAQLADDSLSVGDAVRLEGSYALRGGTGDDGKGGGEDGGTEGDEGGDGTIRGPRLERAPDSE